MLENEVVEMAKNLYADVETYRQTKSEQDRNIVGSEMFALRSIVSAYRVLNETKENEND